MSSGPSPWVTASHWTGFRPSRSSSPGGVMRAQGYRSPTTPSGPAGTVGEKSAEIPATLSKRASPDRGGGRNRYRAGPQRRSDPMTQYMLGVHHTGPDDEAFNWSDEEMQAAFQAVDAFNNRITA